MEVSAVGSGWVAKGSTPTPDGLFFSCPHHFNFFSSNCVESRMAAHQPKLLLTTNAFSPEEEALLRRCLETPWDDAPLLVYADWVQDHDEEERAAFIRESVRDGTVCHSPPGEAEVWLENHLPERDWIFVRGLPVWLVESDLPHLSGEDEEMSDTQRKRADLAVLSEVARQIRRAHRSGWPVGLSLYQTLPVDLPFGNAGIRRLAMLEELGQIGVLRLNNLEVGESGLRRLANSPHVKNLWYLRLADAGPGSVEEEILRSSPFLANLRVIDAPDSEDTEDEAEWRD